MLSIHFHSYATEKLNAQPGFFASLVYTVVDLLGEAFPEVRKDPEHIIDIINEEELLFLRTLNRGRKLLDRTIAKLPSDTSILPGDVTWRLYDTYGFPVDLTQLMAEEKGLSVDMEGYENAKQIAYIKSQGLSVNKIDEINLDVHGIAELKNRQIPLTNDSHKYNYASVSDEPTSEYTFKGCIGEIVAIRHDNKFVDTISNGQKAALILDQTNFYAESGGQIYDQGVMINVQNEADEFLVDRVYNRGGYIIHIGIVEGTLSVGTKLNLFIDTKRRSLTMKNHSATHALNHCLWRVLGKDTEQKGSLVVPEKLRFDFNSKSAMTIGQIAQTEKLMNDIVNKNMPIYAQEIPLSIAKSIRGLRSVFDEVYPDPVRVLSFGVSVDELQDNPSGEAGELTSVELCGGTHLRRSGHIVDFVISSEEAIAKGIRRIVALTGPEAVKAHNKEKLMDERLQELKGEVDRNTLVGKTSKDLIKRLIDMNEEISHATISHVKKDEMRKLVKDLKKKLDDKERSYKNAMSSLVVEKAKQLCLSNPDANFLVERLEAFSNTKALDAALKQVRHYNPNTAALFVSVDVDAERIFCLASVPKNAIDKGLKANEWVQNISSALNGKGGGKPDSAQASGTNFGNAEEVLNLAKKFAILKLDT